MKCSPNTLTLRGKTRGFKSNAPSSSAFDHGFVGRVGNLILIQSMHSFHTFTDESLQSRYSSSCEKEALILHLILNMKTPSWQILCWFGPVIQLGFFVVVFLFLLFPALPKKSFVVIRSD